MAAATRSDIETWFQYGVDTGKTHMIVICDTFDWEDFPVYVSPGEDAQAKAASFIGQEFERLMEVYNLSLPMADQVNKRRVFNY